MGEQLDNVRRVVRSNIHLAVIQLNKELELAKVLRIAVAIDVDNTIGRPCQVKAVMLDEDGYPRTLHSSEGG